MSSANIAANYDLFTASAFRLESRTQYLIPSEADALAAFLRGEPQVIDSASSSPWLARMARTTVEGKTWSRVHIVDFPLSDYLRYELAGYAASQAVGEQIRLVDRAEHPEFADVHEDFWLFDAETEKPFAHRQNYDPAGRYLGGEPVTDPATLERYCQMKRQVWAAGQPLDMFLAGLAER